METRTTIQTYRLTHNYWHPVVVEVFGTEHGAWQLYSSREEKEGQNTWKGDSDFRTYSFSGKKETQQTVCTREEEF